MSRTHRPHTPWFRRRPRRSERGYVLATAAMIMVPLLVVAGFATDVGGWYREADRMQRAADAAALAGVVWLPNMTKATNVAREVAARNGFAVNGHISVAVTRMAESQLSVEITDSDAPRYFSGLVVSSKSITRNARSSYRKPIPLGSPKNYIGTGSLLGAPNTEGFWAAVNGWCAPKEQGDEFSAAFMGNWMPPGYITDVSCPGGTANPSFRPNYQHSYTLTLPAGRTMPVVVHIYSPRADLAFPDPTLYAQTTTTNFRVREPDDTPFNDADNPLTSCGALPNPKVFSPVTLGMPAGMPGGPPADEPVPETLLGAPGWVRICEIPAGAPAGSYLIDVGTLDGEAGSVGYNAYSILASYNGDGVTCDVRTDGMCPGVSGREHLSMKAEASTPQADLFLASVSADYAGQTLEVDLFDPGEGGNYLEILDPNGDPTAFTWQSADGDYSGGPTTQLDVSGCVGWAPIGPGRASACRFNERNVIVSIPLAANYTATYGTKTWWKVRYAFSIAVTDRTTISVTARGAPVHLTE
ncbi:MAG TPA: pilus assembly protein TadG-related protein [Microthrixaceae bacterium]|jgi:Flp pilus assembly protein TadG|nr:pilus assembly protein TadG-related protein [Microthrixaceae bacterium]HMT26098.1 pilus assembly protein TadG-related protein [Microthrixaceae bacterium]HMT61317.1 pilus assembly protein TadG-related protein [Microthrixaceae bacterium]